MGKGSLEMNGLSQSNFADFMFTNRTDFMYVSFKNAKVFH